MRTSWHGAGSLRMSQIWERERRRVRVSEGKRQWAALRPPRGDRIRQAHLDDAILSRSKVASPMVRPLLVLCRRGRGRGLGAEVIQLRR